MLPQEKSRIKGGDRMSIQIIYDQHNFCCPGIPATNEPLYQMRPVLFASLMPRFLMPPTRKRFDKQTAGSPVPVFGIAIFGSPRLYTVCRPCSLSTMSADYINLA
jgi:hypothetical protein